MNKAKEDNMENEKKLKKTFCSALSVAEDKIDNSLEYNGIPEWDSIGHMTLISAIGRLRRRCPRRRIPLFDIRLAPILIVQLPAKDRRKFIRKAFITSNNLFTITAQFVVKNNCRNGC